MKEDIKKIIIEAVKEAGFAVPQNFAVETPPDPEMGDFATNIAMMIAGREKKNPKEMAEKIVALLKKEKDIEKVEIAGPGFINITIKNSIYINELKKILSEKEQYGRGGKKLTHVNVEYVSANPTGPLHVGNARGGPIGEALAGLFSFLGYPVNREFYVNDMGLQIERFGNSLYYWYAKKGDPKIEFPADGYPSPYIEEISEEIQKDNKEKLAELEDESDLVQFFIKEGLYHTIKSIREDCELIGIKFDTWSYESNLQHSGKAETTIERLKKDGFTTKKEGALWFKNPEDKELADKESVLIKSDGKSFTYFTDDITYHLDKIARGDDLLINIWGGNHHGHISRFRAAMRAVGVPDEKIKILLYQYIRLKKSGKVASMGKRLGNFVTLREVIESGVEPDAFKYFILAQNSNTPFDFDLEQAADTSEKNPVFYIKYAHARICSILHKVNISNCHFDSRQGEVEKSSAGKKISRQARDDNKGGEVTVDLEEADLSLLSNPREIALYKEIVGFPQLLEEISENFQIQSLPHFAYKIAGLFHNFYANCQVITDDKKMTAARLSLVLATKYVLSNILEICGIEAPEHM